MVKDISKRVIKVPETKVFTAPWYPWYVRDILASQRVDNLSLAEEGAYRRALDKAWMTGSVPANPKDCASVIGKRCSVKIAATILRLFVKMPRHPSRMIHEKLEKIRAIQEEKYEKNVKGGKARAEQRARNAEYLESQRASKDGDSASTAQAPLQHRSSTATAPLKHRYSTAVANQNQNQNQKEEKKEKKAATPGAIEAIRAVCNRYPPKAGWPRLAKAVGDSPNIKQLTECFEAWVLKGNNPTNYAWVTDWYVNGIPAYKKKAVSSGDNYDPKTDLLSPDYQMDQARPDFATDAEIYFKLHDDGTLEKYEQMKINWLARPSCRGLESEIEEYERGYKFRQRFSEENGQHQTAN